MSEYTYYSNILRTHSFASLPDNDLNDNLIYPKQKDVNSYYTLSYKSVATASILLSTGYYTNNDEEYLHFRPLSVTQENAVDVIFHNSTNNYNYSFSVFFSDIVKINFNDGAIDNADIVFYQNDVNSQIFQNAILEGLTPENAAGYTHGYDFGEKKYGDIILNEDVVGGWSNVDEGSGQFFTILHEIGHSLGLSHPTGNLNNQKYTVLSQSLTPDHISARI